MQQHAEDGSDRTTDAAEEPEPYDDGVYDDGTAQEDAAVQGDDPAAGRPAGRGPDVFLDVPRLKVDEIDLDVEDLRARVSLQAEVLDLLKLNVGADVALGQVHLGISGVEAQARLEVRLDNVALIINRVLTTLDRNPQILEELARGVGSAAGDVGRGAGSAVRHVGEGAGSAVEDVGGAAGEAVGEVAQDVGDAVEGVGGRAGEAVAEVGGVADRAGAGAGAGDAAREAGQAAGRRVRRTPEAAGGGNPPRRRRIRDDGSGAARPTARRSAGKREEPP
ncbi:hypothetical protein [Streptomyces sp. NRRL F-5650]|uniref:hypothetical protein n=1 Tax=Streptomyces sp. NRRL F-5650 TaxID=1463868 RepID=UPI000A57D0D7|nr:hypothetical protein [Streptomyces sp. NRRL F-5650]